MGQPKIIKVVELVLEEKEPPSEPEFEIVEEHPVVEKKRTRYADTPQ